MRFTNIQTTTVFYIDYTYTRRVKVLKDDGVDWANVEFSIITKDESVRGLAANAYNMENGKLVKTKMEKDVVFKEESSATRTTVKFSVPAVKVGTVFEYHYTIHSKVVTKVNDWIAQKSVPVVSSLLDITIPEYFMVNANQLGGYELMVDRKEELAKFSVITPDMRTEQLTCKATRYVVRGENIPALRSENFIWSVYDNLARMEFEFSGTSFPGQTVNSISNNWADAEQSLLSDEDFAINGKNYFAQQTSALNLAEMSSNAQRVAAMVEVLHRNMRWNGKHSWYTKDLKKAVSQGSGNSAEMNFLLMGMLKDAKVPYKAVVLSGRSFGRLPLFRASLERLTDVIVEFEETDGSRHYVDASDRSAYIDALPQEMSVDRARVIGRNETVSLLNLSNNNMTMSVNANLSADGVLSGMRQDLASGVFSHKLRNAIVAESDSLKYIESLNNRYDIDVTSFTLIGIDEYSASARCDIGFTKNVDVSDNRIYFNPMVFLDESENIFKDDVRKLPIELPYTEAVTLIANVQLPEGYTIEEMPKSEGLRFKDNDMLLLYKVVAEDNRLNVMYKFLINRQIYQPEEYAELKDFFQLVVDHNNAMVVLSKN
ncbi:MAG: DUF3857 domain-containing protein [Muribaculaceae bacterium]